MNCAYELLEWKKERMYAQVGILLAKGSHHLKGIEQLQGTKRSRLSHDTSDGAIRVQFTGLIPFQPKEK